MCIKCTRNFSGSHSPFSTLLVYTHKSNLYKLLQNVHIFHHTSKKFHLPTAKIVKIWITRTLLTTFCFYSLGQLRVLICLVISSQISFVNAESNLTLFVLVFKYKFFCGQLTNLIECSSLSLSAD